MKKIFEAPKANFVEVEMESAILGASAIVSGGTAQSTGGTTPGGNGGDANARHAGTTQPNVNANISAYELN